MLRLPKFVTKTLSTRLSLTIVSVIGVLLTVALLIMLRYTRQSMKEETMKNATQTLETTVEQIDNILLSVEQTAGNVYWDMTNHLDQPDRMFVYCRKVVEINPNIIGCAIAFEPNFYQEKGRLFMAYVHRTASDELLTTDSTIIQADIFGNRPYNEQVWYTKPLETGKPLWINPLKNEETEEDAITSFVLPIYATGNQIVGVMRVDVALNTLSEIVQAAKPTSNAYCTLLGSDGSYIIHPDSNKLLHQTVFTQTEQGADPTVKEAVEAMLSGQTGYKVFRRNNMEHYVFFKPFKRAFVQGRSTEGLGWSIGIVYPKEDIFGSYNQMLYYVLLIAAFALLLLLILCRMFTHRQLLPLRLLTKTAQRISKGHYDEPIPESWQQDEIGRLQNHFRQMQQSLATHVYELEQLTTNLQERGEVLQSAYEQTQEADRMKTAFLHNMTNQMATPVGIIEKDVKALYDLYNGKEKQKINYLITDIQQQGVKVTDLLNHLLEISERRKEGNQP